MGEVENGVKIVTEGEPPLEFSSSSSSSTVVMFERASGEGDSEHISQPYEVSGHTWT